MRVCTMFVRALVGLALVGAMLSASAKADPTATVSPLVLNFGVPGTVTGTPSVSQQVSVSISGGSFAVTIGFGGPNAGDFSETDTCGTKPSGSNTIAAPGCVINVTFTPSQAAGTKETATLNVTAGSSFTVNLTGSLGSILLFNPVNVAPSNPGASLTNLVTFNTTTLALSCPAGSIATLSSSPDGSGNVLVDNFLTVQMGSNLPPQTNASNLVGNVCPADSGNPTDAGQADCFTSAYQGPAGAGQLNGVNPDTITNAGNTNPLLNGAAGGVPPIGLSGFTSEGVTTPTTTISMLDGGGFVASGSLFLVTQCVPNGVAPGGTITGNPVTKGNPSSQTQTFTFDTGGGQNIGLTTSTSTAQQQNTVTIPDGTVPIVTDIGIPQNLFSQLVKGTSSAPAVCLRMTGETDASGAAMCKGYLIQCKSPKDGSISGDNCVPSPSTARNLLDQARFASPDTPAGTNFLGTACSVATNGTNCASTNLGGQTPVLIGPGMLLGSDKWLCAPGADLTTCANQELTTQTPLGNNYSAANCALTGSLTGDLCPLDTLTQFEGAADPVHGSTTSGKNSLFVPVVNMPKPFTTITTDPAINGNGWVNKTAVTVNFTSNAANYTAATPSPNGFIPAAPYSLTYGIAPASSPLPDTTYPVAGDTTNWSPIANQNFGAQNPGQPLCSANTPLSFPSSAALVEPEGVYTLHYFTTDCALTEELLFNPQGKQLTDPTANWASFRTLTFGVDKTAPTFSGTFSVPGTNFIVGQKVMATFTCADAGSGVTICGTQTVAACTGTPGMGLASYNTPVAIDTSFAQVGPHIVNAVDCAGNPSTTSVTYTVSPGPAELAIANVPNPLTTIKTGNNLTYNILVLNLGPNTANNIVVTDAIPANTSYVSAMSGIVSCTFSGCSDLTTGSACGLSGNVVTCTTPTVKPFLPGLTGYVIKLVVKVSAPSTVKSISDTATVSSANPDPIKSDNTVTVVTKVTQ